MIANIFLDIIAKILKVSQKCKIPIMFMGGIAVSVWAEPRATYDIDGIIDGKTDGLDEFIREIEKEGFFYDRNESIKLIQNLPFITLVYKNYEMPVDLFLAKSDYAKEALARRQEVSLSGISIPIISPEDLILYKLLAGRRKDYDDIREILIGNQGKLNMEYLKDKADKLRVITFLEDEISSLNIKPNYS